MNTITTIREKLYPHVPLRVSRRDPFWNGKKKPFFIAIAVSGTLLQLLFLTVMCWMHGSLHNEVLHKHNINFLLVDYDQGVVGHSFVAAEEQLRSASFPSVQQHSIAEFPHPADIHQAVRNGDFWAGVYIHPGASVRLSAALQGGDAAVDYNPEDVVTYIWNEVRYPAATDSVVQSSLNTYVQAARLAYNHINGTSAITLLNTTTPAAIQALLNPWTASTVNILPTTQGPRVFYNTVSMVMPIIMQFFFLLAINGIASQFQLYARLPLLDNALIRLTLALSFTCVGALCHAGYIWAYREHWAVDGVQFVLVWMTIWLYMHINFLVIDVATGFIPPPFLPFFVLSWVILNVTSTVFPFELEPGFYRIGYAWPAHEIYSVLITILSRGGVDRLHIALPILFSYEILLFPLVGMAMRRRCVAAAKIARAAEEKEELVRKSKVFLEKMGADGLGAVQGAQGRIAAGGEADGDESPGVSPDAESSDEKHVRQAEEDIEASVAPAAEAQKEKPEAWSSSELSGARRVSSNSIRRVQSRRQDLDQGQAESDGNGYFPSVPVPFVGGAWGPTGAGGG